MDVFRPVFERHDSDDLGPTGRPQGSPLHLSGDPLERIEHAIGRLKAIAPPAAAPADGWTQLGAMGSNLLWPLTRVRFPGLNLIRSGDAIPNFFEL